MKCIPFLSDAVSLIIDTITADVNVDTKQICNCHYNQIIKLKFKQMSVHYYSTEIRLWKYNERR